MFRIIKTYRGEKDIEVVVECSETVGQIKTYKNHSIILDDMSIKNPHLEYNLVKEILIANNIIQEDSEYEKEGQSADS